MLSLFDSKVLVCGFLLLLGFYYYLSLTYGTVSVLFNKCKVAVHCYVSFLCVSGIRYPGNCLVRRDILKM